MDMVAIDVASKMGWDYSEYKNDNTYDEENPDEAQSYNDERTDIVNEAIAFIEWHLTAISDTPNNGR